MIRRARLLAILLGASALACWPNRSDIAPRLPASDRAIRVTATATAESSSLGLGERVVAFEGLRRATFDASAQAPYPADANDQVQRLVVARAAARRAALRALAERLAGQASTVGESLADLLADFSGGEARLGETLEAHSLSTYTEAETGSTAQARVLGELVYESLLQLLLEAPPESKRPPTAGELEERRRQACRRARADAVDRLYEALLDERLPGAASIAVADAVAADPAVGRALRAMLEAIEPIEIPSADDERCGVTLVFDRARLADLAPP